MLWIKTFGRGKKEIEKELTKKAMLCFGWKVKKESIVTHNMFRCEGIWNILCSFEFTE